MNLEENHYYIVDNGWIDTLYGPTLTHGDRIQVLIITGDRINCVRLKNRQKDIVVFRTTELHDGSLIKEKTQ